MYVAIHNVILSVLKEPYESKISLAGYITIAPIPTVSVLKTLITRLPPYYIVHSGPVNDLHVNWCIHMQVPLHYENYTQLSGFHLTLKSHQHNLSLACQK